MDIFKSWLVEKPIAHRGLFNNNAGIPENSLKAFQKAIDKGYPIELDIQLLKDDTVVVFHDSELGRMTGKDGYLSKLTIDDLPNYKLLDTDECIPTLQQVFDLVKGQVPILIEIKTAESAKIGHDEAIMLDLIQKYKGEYAIQSVNPFTLEWFSQHAPKIWRGLINSFWTKEVVPRPQSPLVRFVLRYMFFAKRAKPNFINHDIRHIPNRRTNKWKHIPLLSWVCYNQEDYIRSLQVSDNTVFQDFEPKI